MFPSTTEEEKSSPDQNLISYRTKKDHDIPFLEIRQSPTLSHSQTQQPPQSRTRNEGLLVTIPS